MKTLSKLVIGTVAGVGIALAAVTYAHGPGGYGPGGQGYGMGMHGPGGYGYGRGMHGPGFGGPGAVDTRLETLKSELKLTDKQTVAWGTFEKAVRGEVETMLATHDAMHTNVQNQDTHIAFMEQRLEGVKTVQKARTDLYKVLTPDQKIILDRYGWFHGPRI